MDLAVKIEEKTKYMQTPKQSNPVRNPNPLYNSFLGRPTLTNQNTLTNPNPLNNFTSNKINFTPPTPTLSKHSSNTQPSNTVTQPINPQSSNPAGTAESGDSPIRSSNIAAKMASVPSAMVSGMLTISVKARSSA